MAYSAHSSTLRRHAAPLARRGMSTKSASPLEADAGGVATHAHHAMTTFLVVAAPAMFAVPDSMTDGFLDKAFGLLVAVNVSAHSWIGLNYVATDYVPKVSKKLLPPARLACAGVALVTLGGLSKIALNNKGGTKGTVKGLWNPRPKETEE